MQGESLGKVCDLDAYVTDMSWFPSAGQQTSDMFAVSCSDGTVRLISKSGNEQKKINAANGAAFASSGAKMETPWLLVAKMAL